MKQTTIPEEMYDNILKACDILLMNEIKANTVVLNGNKFGVFVKRGYRPTIFGMAVEYANLPKDIDFFVQYKEPQPMTNADRIRNMSDTELANYLSGLCDGCVNCPMYYSEEDDECIKHCNSAWQEWVRKEAEE